MSSPRADRQLDALFHEALRPTAGVEAPGDAWHRVVRRLDAPPQKQMVPVARLVHWFEHFSVGRIFHRYQWRTPLGRKIISYLHGFETLYPPSTTKLVSREVDRSYLPSSFIGVAAKQVLDLRLAS